MKEYYRLCPLELGRSIHFGEGELTVDLDAARDASVITRDDQLLLAVAPEHYFWVSGGGSVLLEGRSLLVVERPMDARVNPGKLSLFTGRADDETEWREPERLVRELVEELMLVDDGGQVLRLDLGARAVNSDAIRREFASRSGHALCRESVELRPVSLPTTSVRLTANASVRACELTLHVNELRDINALFLFEANLAVDQLWALDGEADQRGQRRILALDVAQMIAIDTTFGSNRNQRKIEDTELTEHCRFLVHTLRQKLLQGV
jgi:hypothetical protein